MKRAPRTYSWYPLRSRGVRRWNREHSKPTTATPRASKIRHPQASQLLLEQRYIHLVEFKYCEGTRPKNQLEASKQQHLNLCCNISRASAQVTLHTTGSLSGVGWFICICHVLELLKGPGLDTNKATKLALKLHAHSVQYAYKLASTRRALEKTPLNSHHQVNVWGTASKPPDPH
eukprot:1140579-Pelagomonas_calceolata.AAC.1